MARISIMRSMRSCGASWALIALLCACCSDEGVRPPNGDKRVCEVEPSMIDFGTLETGEIADTTVTIANAGDIPFTCSISTDSRHYEITSVAGPDTLERGEWLMATVRFKPDTVGTIPCSIATGCSACGDISCTGVGVELSVCDVDPQELAFGALPVGGHLDSSFVVRNTGGGVIRGEIGEANDHYSILEGIGEYCIGADESVTVTVRYEPLSSGSHECTIETGTSACARVTCSGTGTYTWQIIETGTFADLQGVWGSSGTDVVAVGTGGTIIRYDGSAWHSINSNTSFDLYDVWGSASYDIFVVGAARTLLHHNGYSWGFMNSPAAGDLSCIEGTAWNNVFAIGNGAIRYNGWTWSISLDAGCSLTDLWMHSATSAFAVDTAGTILRFDSTSWSTMDSPIYTRLSAVWGSSPNNLYVVASKGDIFNYDGEQWRRKYNSFYTDLYAIWGSAADDIYVVGQYFTVIHYNGTAWEMILRDGSWDEIFYDVWGTSGSDIFFVGTGGIIYHYGRLID